MRGALLLVLVAGRGLLRAAAWARHQGVVCLRSGRLMQFEDLKRLGCHLFLVVREGRPDLVKWALSQFVKFVACLKAPRFGGCLLTSVSFSS